MCIICYKPAKAALPPYDVLKNCYENNPDGAGYMIKEKYGVRINKGFFSFEQFYKSLTNEKNITDKHVGIHFRITTHGATNKLNCHPFAITDKTKAVRKPKQTTSAAVMHNGTISVVNASLDGLSDTAIYTRDLLTSLKDLNGGTLTDSQEARTLINATRNNSRLLIFDDAGVAKYGTWEFAHECYFSNSSYSRKAFSFWLDDHKNEQIKKLPFSVCGSCPWCSECNKYGAECETFAQASYISSYYNKQNYL